jgi:hypothetical protein
MPEDNDIRRHDWKRELREHPPLGVDFHRVKSGRVFAQYPSGAVYEVRPDGWRRVPDKVLAEARAAWAEVTGDVA